jgi:hypothetical protein
MLKLFKYGSEHPITLNLSQYSNEETEELGEREAMKIIVSISFSDTQQQTFVYKLDHREVERFKERTLNRLKKELGLSLEDIPISEIEDFLNFEISFAIAEDKLGCACSSGIVYDDQFGTVSLNFCDEHVTDMLREFAEQVCEDISG